MSVYDRTYKGYDGPTTDRLFRFLVISRYALQDVFRSRLFVGFFVACFLPMLVNTVLIYLHYNVEALSILNLSAIEIVKINTTFFYFGVVVPQSFLSLFLILLVGPALISPDLRNQALPLYLSRPVNKTDYVLGKLAVVVGLAFAVTIVPGGFLFLLQSALAGGEWLSENMRIGPALVLGFGTWILVLSIFALAVSAWVKWKPFARILFLGSILVTAAVGNIFKLVYDTWWGSVMVLADLMIRVWDFLLGRESVMDIPWPFAWFCLMAFAGVSLLALYRRIRAFEVIS